MSARAVRIALALLVAWAACPAAAAVDVAAALPPSGSVAGWTAAGKAETYTRDNLWDFIDGGADYYLAYDFRRVVVQRYRKGGDEIAVELWDMGSSAEAFGVWSNDPPREQPPVGQQSAYAGGLLQFWKGPVYGRVVADRETPALKKAVIALGKQASTRIKETGRLPGLLQALPRKGRAWRSERYFHRESILDGIIYLGGGNPLGLGAKTEAVFARYGPKGQTRLLVVRYPTRAAADQAAARNERIVRSKTVAAWKGKAVMFRATDARGRGYVGLAGNAPTDGEASQLLLAAKAAVERLR